MRMPRLPARPVALRVLLLAVVLLIALIWPGVGVAVGVVAAVLAVLPPGSSATSQAKPLASSPAPALAEAQARQPETRKVGGSTPPLTSRSD